MAFEFVLRSRQDALAVLRTSAPASMQPHTSAYVHASCTATSFQPAASDRSVSSPSPSPMRLLPARVACRTTLGAQAERGDDAEAGRERAWLQVQLGEAISTSLSRSLEEQQAQYRALEGRYQTLQAEATSARRAFQFELEAQVATSRLDHASEVDELKAQLTRARESVASLQRSEASLSATLEDAAPREELVAAQAAADAANAAQRAAAAGRIRAVIALARTQRRVERLEKEVAELRAAAAASVRHGKE